MTIRNVKEQLSRSQVFEWGFRALLALVLWWAGGAVHSIQADVKQLPLDLAQKMAEVASKFNQLELAQQRESALHVTVADWTIAHASYEGRLSVSENKLAVLGEKFDTLAKNQEKTTIAVENLDRTLTGFQIDFNHARQTLSPRK